MGGIELPAEDLIGSGTDIPNSRRPQQFLPQYGLFDQPLAGATVDLDRTCRSTGNRGTEPITTGAGIVQLMYRLNCPAQFWRENMAFDPTRNQSSSNWSL